MPPSEPIEEILDVAEAETSEGDADDFESQFGEPTAGDTEALRMLLAKTIDERDSLHDRLLRSHAEFQNFRKRKEAEAVQVRRIATEAFALKVIPVLDNFSRTAAAIRDGATLESLTSGVTSVERQLALVLESEGFRRVDSVGQPFDPQLHEAIGMVQSDDHASETVVEELEPGYMLGDKLVRPARVRVAQ